MRLPRDGALALLCSGVVPSTPGSASVTQKPKLTSWGYSAKLGYLASIHRPWSHPQHYRFQMSYPNLAFPLAPFLHLFSASGWFLLFQIRRHFFRVEYITSCFVTSASRSSPCRAWLFPSTGNGSCYVAGWKSIYVVLRAFPSFCVCSTWTLNLPSREREWVTSLPVWTL